MGTTRANRAAPSDLAALESSSGDLAIMGFPVPAGSGRAALTAAEADVVAYVLAGRSNAEIAAARGTSTRTVANQIASLFRKLGVTSRLELVVGPALRPDPALKVTCRRERKKR